MFMPSPQAAKFCRNVWPPHNIYSGIHSARATPSLCSMANSGLSAVEDAVVGVSGDELTRIPQDRLLGEGLLSACGRLLVCALALLAISVTTARAQAPSVPGSGQIFYTSIEPLGAVISRLNPGGDPRPKSTEGAFPILDWLIYPGLGFGAGCNTNLNYSPINGIRACGPQITPTLIAAYNTGIQRTIIYAVGDIRWYPLLHAAQLQLVDTREGIVHVWEIQRDLIFRIQGEALQAQQGSNFTNLVSTGVFATSPVSYNQLFGSTSLQKNFAAFFTAVGGSVTDIMYRNVNTNIGTVIDEQFQNGIIPTVNGRLGYYIGPVLYTYVEPSYNWHQYNDSSLDSQGYRAVLGLGSDRIGLFQGEIYGGWAVQKFVNPLFGELSIPVYGGRVSWYPTPFVTVTARADVSFGTTDFAVAGFTPSSTGTIVGSNAAFTPNSTDKVTTVGLNATWDFSRLFAFSATVQNQQLDYLGSFRKDDIVSGSVGVTYKIWEKFGVQFTYTRQQLFSNDPNAPYSQNYYSVGGNGHF
jgi:Putative beta-barrel porin 2